MAGETGNEAGNGGPDSGVGPILPVFRGVSELTLDSKGRLAIPTRHRDALAALGTNRLVLTADSSRCLLLYPLVAWQRVEADLMRFPSLNEHARNLQRLILGYADDAEIDGAGRILVPPALRRFAGLDKQAVLVGQGHKFELWDDVQWQAQTAKATSSPAADLPPELASFSL